jgi:hypothetical protein
MWVGPWLIPRGLAFFQSIRASNRRPGTIQPPPPHIRHCLNILYVFAIVSILRTLPYFSPPNIFRDTNSRLQIPTSVLFSRLNNVRDGNLSLLDHALKDRYTEAPTDFALLYATYGPDVMAYCPFCNTGEPSTYLVYALPSIFAPHLLHVFLLGIITSSFVSGKEGNRWRLVATIAGVSLAAAELTLILRYDWKLNATKRTIKEADFFFWNLRLMRLVAFAVVDLLLGWALWLTSTNRWLAIPPSVSEVLKNTEQLFGSAHSKLFAFGHIQNTIFRDDQLRGIGVQYWTREPRLMEEIDQEREVIDARRLALSRMDHASVQLATNNWVERIWAALKSEQPPVASQAWEKSD